MYLYTYIYLYIYIYIYVFMACHQHGYPRNGSENRNQVVFSEFGGRWETLRKGTTILAAVS